MGNTASRDGNFVPTLTGVSSVDLTSVVTIAVNPSTHRVLVDLSGGISGLMQKDIYVATDQQTAFTATQTVAYDFYLSINGAIQTPTTDYTVSSGIATLTAGSYPNGVPASSSVIWLYAIS